MTGANDKMRELLHRLWLKVGHKMGWLASEQPSEDYKSWWNQAAQTPEQARISTYTPDEEDYRSRGWYGDANSLGARDYLEVARLDKTSRVLEIGCGMARVGREMAPHVGEWHGVDISGRMLYYARQRTKHLPNVYLYELHGISLDLFPDETFDFVYATTVLTHLDKEDLYQYLIETHRVIKKGKMVFFDIWNLMHPDTYRIWRQNQSRNYGDGKFRGRIQFATACELKRYLEEIGFEIIRFDEERLLRVVCQKSEQALHVPDDHHPPFGYIDWPQNESRVRSRLHVEGWVLDAIECIDVYLDHEHYVGSAYYGDSRPDVGTLFPRYPDASQSGYHLEIPLENYSNGYHTLQVIAIDRHGNRVDLAGNHLGFTIES
jgi:ubiquinone/menaquinone biosynthesis C-methylase UbiE